MSDLDPQGHFHAPISAEIWDMKYRFKDPFSGEVHDETVEDTWLRVARALAAPETTMPTHMEGADAVDAPTYWEEEFYRALEGFKFIPAGRILAGAGTERRVTLFNCYVMGTVPDSMDGIFENLKEAALTMQQGGGIGYDFSPLRPKGAPVKGVGSDASGPLTFMDVWDAMCRTVMSAGSRRGAMMATMRCDHPDIESFIEAKHDTNRLRMFNMSVLVTDAFMEAVKADADWPLAHVAPPAVEKHQTPKVLDRTGETAKHGKGLPRYVYRVVKARDLWNKIMEATYAYAEPGVIFVDRINRDNNLSYMETISATNPCGEQPLPPYGACLLGSINLAAFVENAYASNAGIDSTSLKKVVRTAVRMMDNVNDVSLFPLEEQRDEAKAKRRIGLGITGLADALLMCGLRYGSDEAAKRAGSWAKLIALEAYQASIDLAREKGAFPALNTADYTNGVNFAARLLTPDMKRAISETGIRNSHLLSIAPTGTISLYAGNVSSGVEPIFAASYNRKVLQPDGSKTEQRVVDYAVSYWEAGEKTEDRGKTLPPAYVDAQTLTPAEHIKMQAAIQPYIDTSISKTVNVPEDISFEDFKAVYQLAFDEGCKGCTTYRPNEITGSVISVEEKAEEAPEDEVTNIFADEQPTKNVGIEARVMEWLNHPPMEGYGARHKALLDLIEGRDQPKSLIVEADYSEIEKRVMAYAAQSNKHIAFLEPGHPLHIEPQERGFALDGSTYKIKLGSAPAVYVTITDTDEGGNRRPFEIFISTKDAAHMQWSTALMLMISAIFRRPHDSRFVVDELKSVFDPKGGGFWQGKYWNSVVAAIGRVIEIHMIRIGYINDPNVPEELAQTKPGGTVTGRFSSSQPNFKEFPGVTTEEQAKQVARRNTEAVRPDTCPECHASSWKNEGGCATCLSCGHSKCG